MTYYLYHIFDRKIGMTTNPKHRIEKQQGYRKNEYEILHKSKDLIEISTLELLMQKKFDYKVDEDKYEDIMQINATDITSTFPCSMSELKEFLKVNKGYEWETQHGKFKLDRTSISWITKNIMQSKFRPDRCYIYNKSLAGYLHNKKTNSTTTETNPQMKPIPHFLDEFISDTPKKDIREIIKEIMAEEDKAEVEQLVVFDLIRQWATERGLYDKGDVKTQYCKLGEEFGELGRAIIKNNMEEFVDAVGDIIVVLTNLTVLGSSHFDEKITIEGCIQGAYDVIKERKGKMIGGSFVKDGKTIKKTL